MWLLDRLLDGVSANVDLTNLRGKITVVIGNGLSQSAAYLASDRDGPKQSVGWWKAVADAAKKVCIDKDLDLDVDKDLAQVNPLAIMEAIERRKGRDQLMDHFQAEFENVDPCRTHTLLAGLEPRHIVTTNYDAILEKTFPKARILVRDFVTPDDPSSQTIHKIHGSLSARNEGGMRPVISESDYDECLQKLKDSRLSHPDSALWTALSGPVLVIGKGLYWHDLSFLYALRVTRERTEPAYWVCESVSKDMLLHLDNVQIKPIHVRLPSDPENGHYYAGVGLALARLACDKPAERDLLKYIEANDLVRAPAFVGIGIAAHNTVGYVGHPNTEVDKKIDAVVSGGRVKDFKVEFPPPGRRNRTFHSEEFPGGSALTALGVFSALATKRTSEGKPPLRRSLISVIDGRDPYSTTIRDFCGRSKLEIDTDGLATDGDQTWHSTVVLHDIESHDGVRFFFDRKIRRLSSGGDIAVQLRAQLANPGLRLLYMDKFLAQPSDVDKGFLMQHKDAFEPLLDRQVDVLYETGGAGSPRGQVEGEFAKYFSVVASSFPFFAKYILSPNERSEGDNDEFGLDQNGNSKEWWNIDFLRERVVLERFLKDRGDKEEFEVPKHWRDNAGKFLRTNNAPRRWFVVTLHERGALGFDADSGYGVLIPATKEVVVNTAGAGDVFRGAFGFELVNQGTGDQVAPNEPHVLRKCVETGVQFATHKCRLFSHGAFLNEISGKKFF